ncbi:MAG: TIGR03936 family radical SAM-associated protein [Chloroflexota bacterium]|nr:TIGR03936 family radical SAM-associated protein [Chloroflexota bacterium]
MRRTEEIQRLRIKFSRGNKVRYISHLDLARSWERIFRRALVPVAYSCGFNPRPRISLAAPLALGIVSNAELMDIFLTKRVSPYSIFKNVRPQLPQGIELSEVQEIPLNSPSLQSKLQAAEYRLGIPTTKNQKELQDTIDTLLHKTSLSWHHMRDTGARYYDLRALIEDIWFIDISHQKPECIIGMLLRSGPQGSGRPEQVAKALGFEESPSFIMRTNLVLSSQ